MIKEDIVECYMRNDKQVIAEMLYDTITKYEKQLGNCSNCKHCFKDKFGSTCSKLTIVNAYGSNEPDVYLKVSDDFSCNKFEAKDNKCII